MDMLNINSITDYASRMATDTNYGKLTDKAKSATNDEELMEACKEFESYLWEQVLKSMKSTVNFAGTEGTAQEQTIDYFMDTAVSDVAKQLTDQNMGPNSLAQQMYEQMKRNNVIPTEEE